MPLIRYAGGILKAYGGLAGSLACCCDDDYYYDDDGYAKECKCCQGYDGDEYICGYNELPCDSEYTVDIPGSPHTGRTVRGPLVAAFGSYYQVYLQYYEMDLNKCDPTITGTVTIVNVAACSQATGDAASCRICDAEFTATGKAPVYTSGVCDTLETNYNTSEFEHCDPTDHNLSELCGCYWEVRISDCQSGDELTEPVPKFIGIVASCAGGICTDPCGCCNGALEGEPASDRTEQWDYIGFYIIDPNRSVRDCCKTCPDSGYLGDDGYV